MSAACTRCQSALEADDIRCPVCALAVPHAAPSQVAQATANVMRCDGCGAALRYSAERQGVRCAFCGSTLQLETSSDPIERAELFVPFVVPPDRAGAALSAWLGKKRWFRPADLATGAAVESLQPLYWVGWVVDAQAHVSWTADSNAGSGRSAWAPHSGQTSLSFQNLIVSASRGLTLDETRELGPGTNLSGAGPAPAGPPNVIVEEYDAQRSAARRIIVESIERTAAAQLQHGTIPGNRFRKVSVAALLSALRTHRFAFPAYVFVYRYRGKPFRAIVHGQSDERVIGSLPISWARVVIAIVVVVAVIGVIVVLASLAAE